MAKRSEPDFPRPGGGLAPPGATPPEVACDSRATVAARAHHEGELEGEPKVPIRIERATTPTTFVTKQPQRLRRRGEQSRFAPAAEDEAADGEPEPEGAERERTDRDRSAPEGESLPAAERVLLLHRERLAPPLLPHGATGTEPQVKVVEDLGRLIHPQPSV